MSTQKARLKVSEWLFDEQVPATIDFLARDNP